MFLPGQPSRYCAVEDIWEVYWAGTVFFFFQMLLPGLPSRCCAVEDILEVYWAGTLEVLLPSSTGR